MTDRELKEELIRLTEMKKEVVTFCVSQKYPAVLERMLEECKGMLETSFGLIVLCNDGNAPVSCKNNLLSKMRRSIVDVPHRAKVLTSRYIRVTAARKAKGIKEPYVFYGE